MASHPISGSPLGLPLHSPKKKLHITSLKPSLQLFILIVLCSSRKYPYITYRRYFLLDPSSGNVFGLCIFPSPLPSLGNSSTYCGDSIDPPLEIPIKLHTFLQFFGALQTPPPLLSFLITLGNSSPYCGSSMNLPSGNFN